MPTELKAPHYPESVEEGTLMTWRKKEGEAVKRDETVADIETDKVVLEVAAPEEGILTDIQKQEGDTVRDGELLATIDSQGAATSQTTKETAEQKQEKEPEPAGAKAEAQAESDRTAEAGDEAENVQPAMSPSVRKLITEHELDPAEIKGTGKDGRITKQDVENHLESISQRAPGKEAEAKQPAPAETSKQETIPYVSHAEGRPEERAPMSRLRARIADRLVRAQQQAALLTTFNEVNMQAIMDLRAKYREPFEKEHGVKLGFMSFFVKASVAALKRFPEVNASVDGKDIVYHGYYDIGIAVSTDRGLIVPVLKNADLLSFAEIEASIQNFSERAKENQLTLDELRGGTFTITNGGVFGSLLSTPIVNPPQSAILGMHKIQPRPVAEDEQVVVRPMMYLALTYDHRIIDGREAVQFLVTLKEVLEEPSSMLLNL